jgi:hypothetical protein
VGAAATADVRSASVIWTGPAADGGSPITGYAIAISPPAPAAVVAVAGTTASISGLADRANLNIGSSVRSAEVYDPGLETFTMLGSMLATARHDHTATLLQSGKVLLLGGYASSTSKVLASAELYSP